MMKRSTGTRRSPGRRLAALGALVTAGLVAGACSAPGAEQPAAADDDTEVSTELGTEPITLEMYAETGFPLAKALADEFTRQYPHVTFNVREDQFTVLTENAPRVLSSDNAPDIIRLPTMVDLVKDGLLKNLDPYFDAYGWDGWPASQLVQLRISQEGPRGSGSLFGVGLGYSVTGVFYNQEQAAQIGMTEPPATIAEFEGLLADAETAGLQPIMQFNKNTAGINFPLQALQNHFGDPAEVADWIFQQPGASFDTPAALRAAETIAEWAEAGYFPADANAIDYTTMMGEFQDGNGVFMFNGDWESGNLDSGPMAGNVGFFLSPPENEGDQHVAMSAPNTFGIGANSANPDAAAYFLNWAHTDETARQISVEVGGSSPGGPAELPIPSVAEGTVSAQTLAASQQLGAENGAVDFTANATGAIFAAAITPELQKLVVGQQTPEGFVTAVQEEYEKELAR